MRIEGPLAYDLLRFERDGHLFTGRHGGFSMVDLSVSREPCIIRSMETEKSADAEKEEFRYPPVVRIYDARGIVCDLCSGMTLKSEYPSGEEYRMLLTGRLPLPRELE